MKGSLSVFKVIRSILLSVGIALVCAFLLLLVFTALSVSAKEPRSFVMPFSLIALGLSAIVCGVTASLSCRTKELPAHLLGALAGAVLVFVLFAVSFVPANGGISYSGGARAAVYAGIVLLSLVGSVLARPRNRRHAKYPVKRKKVRR